MQKGDISRPITAQPLSRRRSGLVVAALLLALYAALILGLRIERPWLFIVYLGTAAILILAYQRLTGLPRWISAAFRDNAKLATVILIVLLALYPIFLHDDPYLIHIGALSAIFAVMALGLNITLGFAGLLDIGFAVYFGAGAYTSAQLAIHFGVSFWLGAVAGGLVAALFGFVVAWPALRVHDHYLGLVTLGYGLMMNLLARNLNFLTNGTDGVIDIPPPAIGSHSFTEPLQILSLSLPFQANFYYLALAAALLTVFFSYRLLDSKLGRAWEAIREDEIAAKCSGVNAQGLKILAFSTGAFFGGIGGAMYGHMIGFISPDSFTFLESITILVMVVIGGAGNILGVVVGAVALVVLPERFREFEDLRLLIFGLALVLLMINRPQGIFPRVRTRRGPQAVAGCIRPKPSAERVNLAMSEVLLQTDGLTMDFGGIRAVNDLSISVAQGEIVAVIGPNGSGKTTLFNLIMHLYHWTAGRLLFGYPAHDLASLATHRINALGIARTFQTIRLFPKLTVLENVLVGMHSRLRGGLLAAVIRGSQVREQERRAEVEARELLSLFGERLISMYDEPAEALSYANRRRLEIARALASKPKLLLLDEPAAGMNPTETREAMEDIRRIRSTGCSILVIEHDMGLVEGLADRVIAMDHGTKIAEGSFQQVRSHPEVIRAYLGSGAYAESVATESAPDRKEMP